MVGWVVGRAVFGLGGGLQSKSFESPHQRARTSAPKVQSPDDYVVNEWPLNKHFISEETPPEFNLMAHRKTCKNSIAGCDKMHETISLAKHISHRQLAINNVRYLTLKGSTFSLSHKQVKVTSDMVRFFTQRHARVDLCRLTELSRKKLVSLVIRWFMCNRLCTNSTS